MSPTGSMRDSEKKECLGGKKSERPVTDSFALTETLRKSCDSLCVGCEVHTSACMSMGARVYSCL